MDTATPRRRRTPARHSQTTRATRLEHVTSGWIAGLKQGSVVARRAKRSRGTRSTLALASRRRGSGEEPPSAA